MNNVFCEKIQVQSLDCIWFCGDIHGQFDLLYDALANAGFNPEKGHRLFACGDLVDVGPQSAKVLALLKQPWFMSVEGNHEQMMLQALIGWDQVRYEAAMNYLHRQGGADILARYNQGRATISELNTFTDRLGHNFGRWLIKGGGGWFFSEETTYSQQSETLNTLKAARLPIVIEVRSAGYRFGVVHAQPLSEHWSDTREGAGRGVSQVLQWSRSDFQQFVGDGSSVLGASGAHVHGVDAVMLGHSIVQTNKPAVRANRVYLDVGAKYGVMPCVLRATEVLERIASTCAER